MKTNTTRFSDRVDDYVKYRPQYPREMLPVFSREFNFNDKFTVADIGSGTGISSKPFIENGNTVFGVEPNKEMREAAEALFRNEKLFISVGGSAEATRLESRSVDLIFCAQAFHWFDVPKTKGEFERILRPGGKIVLAWNERSEKDGFQNEYEQLLYNSIPEYKNVTQKKIVEEDIRRFFAPKTMSEIILPNSQTFDLESFKGRLRSSSYFPKEGENSQKIMAGAKALFNRYHKNGLIDFIYETKIYWG